MSNAGSAGRGWGRQSYRESSFAPMWPQPTPRSAKVSSVTAHCHAATALPTRAYQGDHRRYSLTPATTCAPLPFDKPFHIRSERSDAGDASEAASGSSPARENLRPKLVPQGSERSDAGEPQRLTTPLPVECPCAYGTKTTLIGSPSHSRKMRKPS